MCELCNQETRADYAMRRAEMYERMASVYRAVAGRRLEPHTAEFKKATSGLASAILHDLVDGWSFG